MKKRLLTLALCLVMMTSLLPVTAAAFSDTLVTIDGIDIGKTYCGDTYFTVVPADKVSSAQKQTVFWNHQGSPADTHELKADSYGRYKLEAGLGVIRVGVKFFLENMVRESSFEVTINAGHTDENHDNICDVCDKSVHTWQFTKTDSTLTAQCQNQECGKEVSVSLKADSVTLPDSPFNAQLAGLEQFRTAFPNAAISKIRYDYKGSDGVWQRNIDPIAANAKAGTYQAFVEISNLPGYVVSDGVVAMAENPDGTYTADLYVQYTAVDPAVTAQTGDNRPIELMLVCALAFSALAAAAFILDHKRKYSR